MKKLTALITAGVVGLLSPTYSKTQNFLVDHASSHDSSYQLDKIGDLIRYWIDLDDDGTIDFVALQDTNRISYLKDPSESEIDPTEFPELIKTGYFKDSKGRIWHPQIFINERAKKNQNLQTQLRNYSRWNGETMDSVQQRLANTGHFDKIENPYSSFISEKGIWLVQINFKPLGEDEQYHARVDLVAGIKRSSLSLDEQTQDARELLKNLLNRGDPRIFAYTTAEGKKMLNGSSPPNARVQKLTSNLEAVVTSKPLTGPYVRDVYLGHDFKIAQVVDLDSRMPYDILDKMPLKNFEWGILAIPKDRIPKTVNQENSTEYSKIPFNLLGDMIRSGGYNEIYLLPKFQENLNSSILNETIPPEFRDWIFNHKNVRVGEDDLISKIIF